jgi:hypothetical protein
MYYINPIINIKTNVNDENNEKFSADWGDSPDGNGAEHSVQ